MITITLALLISMASAGLAQTFFESEDWAVVYYKTPSGFNSCEVRSKILSPRLVYRSTYRGKGGFTAGDRGEGDLILYMDETMSDIAIDRIYAAKIHIDEIYSKTVRANWYKRKNKAGGTLIFRMENYVDNAIKSLATGKKLSVKFLKAGKAIKGKTLSFNLKKSYQAFNRFEECLAGIDVNSQ